MTQQEWVKTLMKSIILIMRKNNLSMDDVAFRYTINAAIDNYSLIYWDEEYKKNTNLFHNYELKSKKRFYHNVLMSKDAYEFIYKDREIKDGLHGEHLTPMSYTRKFLDDLIKEDCNGEELDNRIAFAFTDAKYCIITKNEKRILDGAKNFYDQNIVESFLEEYKNYRNISDREKTAYEQLIKEKSSTRTDGFGAIRLYLLKENGVEFKSWEGKSLEFGACLEYLKDGNYNLKI